MNINIKINVKVSHIYNFSIKISHEFTEKPRKFSASTLKIQKSY